MERGDCCQQSGAPEESLVSYVLRRVAASPSSPLRSSALGAFQRPDVSKPSTAALYRVPALSGVVALLVASRPPGLLSTLRWLVGWGIGRRGGNKYID